MFLPDPITLDAALAAAAIDTDVPGGGGDGEDSIVVITAPTTQADNTSATASGPRVATSKKKKLTPEERKAIIAAKNLATLKSKAAAIASCSNYVLSLVAENILEVDDSATEYCFSASEKYLTSEEVKFYEERRTTSKVLATVRDEISRMPPWQLLDLPKVTEIQSKQIEETLKAYDEALKIAEAKYKNVLSRKGKQGAS